LNKRGENMKRTILFLVVAVIAAGGFFACDLFEHEDLGTLTITLPGNELPSSSARAALPPEILNTLRFQIDCTKGKKTISNIYSAGKTVNISLATGTWDITLKVLDEDNYIIGGDTETVSIKPGKTTPVNFKITVVMMKEGASLDGTLSATATADTITIIQPYLTLATPTGQAIEYARGSDDSSPSTAWQDSLIFSGLNPNTTYYIFARSKANSTHKAGTHKVSEAITTLATTEPNIIYYWFDNDVLTTADGEEIKIDKDVQLPIIALGDGYDVLQWEVNGVPQTEGISDGGKTFTFSRSATGEYTIGLFIVKDGKLYNTNIDVTVFCSVCYPDPCTCTGTRTFTSIEDIQKYLNENTGTEAKPLELKVRLDLGDMGVDSLWEELLEVLETWGGYVDLDLTDCTMTEPTFNLGTYPINSSGRIVTLILPDDATSIEGGTNSSGAFRGFAEVTGRNIITIGEYTFCGNTQAAASGDDSLTNKALTSVSFPNATNIGHYAFDDCINLTSIDIPKITSIGVSAFANCISLTSLNIPSVTSIGDYAFRKCSNLASIDMPNVTSIGNYAFQDCTSLTEITVSDSGVPNLNTNMFLNTGILNNTLDNSLVYVDKWLVGCKGTISGSIVLSEGTTFIAYRAIRNQAGLTGITIPDSVKIIDNQAIMQCGSLEEVTIGSGVTSIGVAAFAGNDNLKSVTINRATPPELTLDQGTSTHSTFDYSHADLLIKVPQGSRNAYISAWSGYLGTNPDWTALQEKIVEE
jgi:hypothetical protein